MQACEQSRGQSVRDHGVAVARTFDELIDILEDKKTTPEGWRIPDWLTSSKDFSGEGSKHFLKRLAPRDVLFEYQLYHDCGKPYCLTQDPDGSRHFPGHAEWSAKIWKLLGGCERAAALMSQDMDAHLLKADAVPEFAKRADAASLWLTALAEVHANAPMFGGFDSTSFKAKVKHLERRGKALLALWAQS